MTLRPMVVRHSIVYIQTKSLYVILSGVELSPSEERGESASHRAKRDMATSFGGLPAECYIFCRKPRGLQAISHRRIRSSVLYRIVACSSLPQQNFDFGRHSCLPPLRMTG